MLGKVWSLQGKSFCPAFLDVLMSDLANIGLVQVSLSAKPGWIYTGISHEQLSVSPCMGHCLACVLLSALEGVWQGQVLLLPCLVEGLSWAG